MNDTIVTRAATPAELAAAEAARTAQAAAAAPKPTPRFIGGDERQREVPLRYPVEFDGIVYERLIVRKLVGRDLQSLTKLPDVGEAAVLASLMTGAPVELIEALDADDYVSLSEACQDFLPRRLREASEAAG